MRRYLMRWISQKELSQTLDNIHQWRQSQFGESHVLFQIQIKDEVQKLCNNMKLRLNWLKRYVDACQ